MGADVWAAYLAGRYHNGRNLGVGAQWYACIRSSSTCRHERPAFASSQQKGAPWLSFGLSQSMRSNVAVASARSPRGGDGKNLVAEVLRRELHDT